MTGTAILNLQPAEYARLTGNAPFMALVNGVFDSVPQGTQRPYVTLGEATEIPMREFANDGREVTRTFHIFDQDGAVVGGVAATGNKRGQTILNSLITVLESVPLTVEGFAVVDYVYEFGEPMPAEESDDVVYRHIVARFRATLEAA